MQVTADEIYASYCDWELRPVKLPRADFFNACELGNIDVKRTKTQVVNRLYRVVAAYAEGDLHLFIFYADTLSRIVDEFGDTEETGEVTYGLWETL